MRSYLRSQQLYGQACAVTTGGAQTGSKAPGRVGPIGAYPLYLATGKGPYVWDVDDHRYVDWFNANCSVTLGHSHEAVNQAIREQLCRGSLLSLPTELEATVAQRLVEVIPCAEQIRFVKTGSEACAGAVRIARMATGRDVIAVCDGQYNGWHDWSIARNAYAPGVPANLRHNLVTFRYNDLQSLIAALCEQGNVAAVILEPTLVEAPAPGFLQGVVDLAHQHGALVIFDEMITGGRWALGGAQEYFGVTPDLSTHGKAYANGLPLAFIAGRADLMQGAWCVSGTFGGELLSLAACEAVLKFHTLGRCDGDGYHAIDRMWQVGLMLKDAVNGMCQRLDLPAIMIGPDVRPVLRWERDPSGFLVALFQQELAQHGVLAHPSGWNTSAAHDAEALERTIDGCARALTTVAAALASTSPDAFLRGELIKPAFVRQAVTA